MPDFLARVFKTVDSAALQRRQMLLEKSVEMLRMDSHQLPSEVIWGSLGPSGSRWVADASMGWACLANESMHAALFVPHSSQPLKLSNALELFSGCPTSPTCLHSDKR